MKLFIILGNQLFPLKYLNRFKKDHLFFMAEDNGLCTYEKHHKLKILLFLSSMRSFYENLKKNSFKITYSKIEDSAFKDDYILKIKKILKKNKIPFSHSNIKSSNLCFNKSASKKEIIKNKLMSPKYYLLNINDLNEKKLIIIKSKLKKFVIKPNRSGSSFGIKIIKNQKEFDILISNLALLQSSIVFEARAITFEK